MSIIQLELFRETEFKPKREPVPELKKSNEFKPKSSKSLHNLWVFLRKKYFPHRVDLDNYKVEWSSRRQKRTLASCNFDSKVVRVASEMNNPKCLIWIEPLLYHEMCHAVLGNGVEQTSKGFAWHGKEFKALERRHPGTKALDKWIESGGWLSAVLSARAKAAHRRRKKRKALVA